MLKEDILIHEFAHRMHWLGITFVDADLEQAFNNAKKNGLWESTYAGTNHPEHFAEGVVTWFNANAESIPPNGVHNVFLSVTSAERTIQIPRAEHGANEKDHIVRNSHLSITNLPIPSVCSSKNKRN
jgi:hypothetical protein